jgi:hypothetical protein
MIVLFFSSECQNKMGALKGRRLYLHMQNQPAAMQLEQLVALHGGIVDRFLSKDIHYIITDGLPSQKRPMPPPSVHCSRGKALLHHAMKACDAAPDPIQFAAKFKISCVTVQEFLNFHYRYFPAPRPPISENKTNPPWFKGFFVQSPCIKFEDVQRCYRPQVMQFTRYPSILDAHPVIEYRDPKQVVKSPKKKMPLKEVDHKKGYCEWCLVSYNSLEAHVKKPKHLKRISEQKEFETLDEVISQLPSIDDLLMRLEVKPAVIAMDSESGFVDGSSDQPKTELKETELKDMMKDKCLLKLEYSVISSPAPMFGIDVDKILESDNACQLPSQKAAASAAQLPQFTQDMNVNFGPPRDANHPFDPNTSAYSSVNPYMNPMYSGFLNNQCYGSVYNHPSNMSYAASYKD